MSLFNRKGFKAIRAVDTQSDKIFMTPGRVNGALAGIARTKQHQSDREQRAKFRMFKEQLREAKKSIPLADRAKVNWSEVENT